MKRWGGRSRFAANLAHVRVEGTKTISANGPSGLFEGLPQFRVRPVRLCYRLSVEEEAGQRVTSRAKSDWALHLSLDEGDKCIVAGNT